MPISSVNSESKKGLCTELGKNVFDYGHKAAAEQMRTSWEKLVQHFSTKYGQDISNKLNNKIKVNILTTFQSTEVLVKHATREALVCTGQSNIQEACWTQAIMLRAAETYDPSGAELPMKIETLDNKVSKGDYDIAKKTPIEILESDKTSYGNELRI